ncbi:MAG TPA: hypothetical protein VF606_12555, partial [Geminicoccaceae bacterium]
LDALRADPDFLAVAAGCAVIAARSPEARDTRLMCLARLALERGLADGRPGAVAAVLRSLAPRSPPGGPAEKPAAAPARKRRSPAKAAEPEPEPAGAAPAPDGSRWGMWPDEEEGWVGTDGLPVMAGRPLAVVDAPGGPVRVLDVNPDTVPLAFLETLDGFDAAAVRDLNRSAHPGGGLQWDPVTRTLWSWGGESADATHPPRPDRRRRFPVDAPVE